MQVLGTPLIIFIMQVLGTPLIISLPVGLSAPVRVGVRFTTSPSSSAVQVGLLSFLCMCVCVRVHACVHE